MDFDFVDPRSIDAWDGLLLSSGDNAFFHTATWASVLSESYGFKPLYLICKSGKRFDLVMPMMEVRSLLTGSRGVSLPFTDHCAPFISREGLVEIARAKFLEYGKMARWRFIEWRDGGTIPCGTPAHETYFKHLISLEKHEHELFSCLKESNRRNIRKAVREGVSVTIGRSRESLEAFYRLNCLTRRRHGLPPQPIRFFRKVHEHILAEEKGIVAIASHANRPLSASVFFFFGREAIFKYGASDLARQEIRPGNLLMWEAILWLRSHGFASLDLGRTEPENQGLLRYKRTWGAIEGKVDYHKYSFRSGGFTSASRRPWPNFLRNLFAKTPLSILRLFGGLAYRHIG